VDERTPSVLELLQREAAHLAHEEKEIDAEAREQALRQVGSVAARVGLLQEQGDVEAVDGVGRGHKTGRAGLRGGEHVRVLGD